MRITWAFFLVSTVVAFGVGALGACGTVGYSSSEDASVTASDATLDAGGDAAAWVHPPQPTLNYGNYRSARRDQIFFYQGDLRNLGTTVDEIAEVIKPFDYVVLTNVFEVKYVGAAAKTPYGAVEAKNGTCAAGGFKDANGNTGAELLRALRAKNPAVQIFGYVPATADVGNFTVAGVSNGCTVNERMKLFDCPGGVCTDFIQWIRAWRELEAKYGAASKLDGYFLDLANEQYVSDATLTNEMSFMHSLKSQGNQSYRVMANMIAKNDTGDLIFNFVGAPVRLVDSVNFVARRMLPNDIILKEGFRLLAGKSVLGRDFDELRSRLIAAHTQYQTKWAVIASEKGNLYVPPTHVARAYWEIQNQISKTNCYTGPTGDDNSPDYNDCDVAFTPPNLCKSSNMADAYRAFRDAADGAGAVASQGGIAFTYSEARLGVFNGTVPFCPNDEAAP
jgi:hypothetical protein